MICTECLHEFSSRHVSQGLCDACRIQNDLHGDLLMIWFVGILVFGGFLAFILSGGTLSY